ncbi:MAG: vitamin B12 dependent-methionine synthase activation domain-containing protein, partial [Elainellaceae cyanobacterium]
AGQNGHGADLALVDEVPSTDTPESAVLEAVAVDTQRSEAVAIDIARPTPPFWGTQVLGPEDIPLEELFEYLDLQALIAGQWQFRKPQGQPREEYDLFLAEKAYPILEDLKQQVLSNTLLLPQVVYGYFPCQADGNSLHLYDPAVMQQAAKLPDGLAPVATFDFPRQRSLRRLCISDFFAPRETGLVDVFPMQAVTVGEVATEHAKILFESDRYTDYLYYYGFSVQMAEAVAEWSHARIRRELGLADKDPAGIRDILAQRYQGSRYSFGYPACPNIADQYTLLDLLGTERIGMTMDESEQLYPEQSTTAIVAYHPAAKYFSA